NSEASLRGREKAKIDSRLQNPERRGVGSARFQHSDLGGIRELGGIRSFARQNGSDRRKSDGLGRAAEGHGSQTPRYPRDSRHENHARDHAQIKQSAATRQRS